MKTKILIVEDEPDMAELIEFHLRGAGFATARAGRGTEALKKIAQDTFHLIVLDVMLPELDGLEVCKRLKRDPELARIPILMLTAKASEIDRVLGLELGADDYVTKPFSPRELVLRVKKLLQRNEPAPAGEEIIRVGELCVNVPRHEVSYKGKLIDLTATEFKLITLLVQRRGRVQSREQLLRDVWAYDAMIDTRTVDTHMRRLRDKMGAAARHLDTVRGVGYRFVEEP